MRRLRQKLERDPNHPLYLQTVRGVGYRLVAVAAASVEPETEADTARAADGTATATPIARTDA